MILTVAGMVSLLLAFTLTLTVLLGTATTSRGLVIGVPIAAVMLYDGVHVLARDLAGQLPFPWETTTSAVQVSTGAGLVSPIPIIATLTLTVAAIVTTCWTFEQKQFRQL